MPPEEAILCVDDEPLVLRAMRGTLRRRLGRRYSIEMARNGAEAIELIAELERENKRTRMVVSDAMMPVMDGYALVQWLHEHKPDVLKILITGYGHREEIERLRAESGLLAAFDKPWDVDELATFVERALEGHPS